MQLEVKNVSYRYTSKNLKEDYILKNISFSINKGERVALIAPSGYGKSTLAKIIAGYIEATDGQVLWQGKELPKKGYNPIQLIYQHPEKAVNPRWKMKKILTECWNPEKELLNKLGIERQWLNRWPNELSGGELQRFCIARALSPKTEFLICDEITTMLDPITQAQIWKVLLEISKERKLGMLIITHNKELAKRVCDRNIILLT